MFLSGNGLFNTNIRISDELQLFHRAHLFYFKMKETCSDLTLRKWKCIVARNRMTRSVGNAGMVTAGNHTNLSISDGRVRRGQLR